MEVQKRKYIRRVLFMKNNEINDFGFSIVSEDELKAYEKELEEQLTTNINLVKNKLEGLRDLYSPLLENLKRDPDKQYIYWPNRTEKIDKFIEKIEVYIKENS
jgi:hypothetical protein